MAKMNELYNDIYTYCDENQCWNEWNSASEWNGILGKNYGVPAFTALVNAGLLERAKGYRAKVYEYRVVPTNEVKAKLEAIKIESEKENAKYVVSHYEEAVARRKARYEEMIREAERQLNEGLEWEAEKLEKAKAVLEIE